MARSPEAVPVSGEGATGATAPAGSGAAEATETGFRVALSNFEGPFDLLLSLIAKHEMDITEVSLSIVTSEFIAYLKGIDSEEELDQASEFVVVAATLLDLKVAGLLPQGELVDAEDVALLEARDLLFARLLQYRAFKEAAQWFSGRIEAETSRHVRSVRLEECDVLGVDELALRQEAGDLQVEERRRDHEELRGAVELLRGVEPAQVGDELVGHGRERHLGDVHLVLRDQREQQVERALEVRERDAESGLGGIGSAIPSRHRRAGCALPRDRYGLRRPRHGRPAPLRAAGRPSRPGARGRTR